MFLVTRLLKIAMLSFWAGQNQQYCNCSTLAISIIASVKSSGSRGHMQGRGQEDNVEAWSDECAAADVLQSRSAEVILCQLLLGSKVRKTGDRKADFSPVTLCSLPTLP